MSDEEYVRARWETVELCGHFDTESGDCVRIYTSPLFSIFRSWSAAAEFTRQREEKIRQVRERAVREEWQYRRILSRLEAIQANLKKGMKEA